MPRAPHVISTTPPVQIAYTSGFDVLLRYRVGRLRLSDRRVLNRHRRRLIGRCFGGFVDGIAVAGIRLRRFCLFRRHDPAKLHDQYRARRRRVGTGQMRGDLSGGRDTRRRRRVRSDGRRWCLPGRVQPARRARDRQAPSAASSTQEGVRRPRAFGDTRTLCRARKDPAFLVDGGRGGNRSVICTRPETLSSACASASARSAISDLSAVTVSDTAPNRAGRMASLTAASARITRSNSSRFSTAGSSAARVRHRQRTSRAFQDP